MSAITDRWTALYGCQTRQLGVAIVATITKSPTTFATNKPAIISLLDLDEQFIDGGVSQSGGFTLQMLASDLSAEPPKRSSVACNGSASGQALYVLSTKLNNGIYYITIGDFAAASNA